MKSVLLLFVSLVVPVLAATPPGQENAALEQEIRRLDLAHADAILRRDVEALKGLMAEEVTTNHPTNKVVNEREGIFRMIRDGVIDHSSFVREPEKFLLFPDMVVVMGRETLTPQGKAPRAGQTIRRRYTNIWMKHEEKWLLTVRHAHIVCPD